MDQSFSMNDDLQNLKNLASQLGTYVILCINIHKLFQILFVWKNYKHAYRSPGQRQFQEACIAPASVSNCFKYLLLKIHHCLLNMIVVHYVYTINPDL